jgi:hypothetical protein
MRSASSEPAESSCTANSCSALVTTASPNTISGWVMLPVSIGFRSRGLGSVAVRPPALRHCIMRAFCGAAFSHRLWLRFLGDLRLGRLASAYLGEMLVGIDGGHAARQSRQPLLERGQTRLQGPLGIAALLDGALRSPMSFCRYRRSGRTVPTRPAPWRRPSGSGSGSVSFGLRRSQLSGCRRASRGSRAPDGRYAPDDE